MLGAISQGSWFCCLFSLANFPIILFVTLDARATQSSSMKYIMENCKIRWQQKKEKLLILSKPCWCWQRHRVAGCLVKTILTATHVDVIFSLNCFFFSFLSAFPMKRNVNVRCAAMRPCTDRMNVIIILTIQFFSVANSQRFPLFHCNVNSAWGLFSSMYFNFVVFCGILWHWHFSAVPKKYSDGFNIFAA